MSRAPVIAYDLLNLFLLGPSLCAPRGIDRIDFALADYFFTASKKNVVGVLPTPVGVRVLDADTVRTGLRYLEGLWQETIDPMSDQDWIDICKRLNGIRVSTFEAPRSGRRSFVGGVLRLRRQLELPFVSPGRPVRSDLPSGAAYVNIGQAGLSLSFLFRWLESRPDVCPVMMMHDVIPIEFPDHVPQIAITMHKRMVDTIARYGHGLIVPSQHAGKSIAAELMSCGRNDIPTLARHLPLASIFAESGTAPPELAGISYFVICGSIEPRKNHSLVIALWQRLIDELGDSAPHLVIVGSPAWRGERILETLKTDRLLQARVHHASRLSSPALKKLMVGSAGLLMPSFAEGFGLPVFEANMLGVPTIASDIGAHREIANDETILLPPDDVDAWEAAIRSLPSCGSGRMATALSFDCSQTHYGKDIDAFVEECSERHSRYPTANVALSQPFSARSSLLR